MKTELYTAWICDPVAPLFSVGLQTEAPDVLARLNDRVHQAEAVLRSWVLRVRGRQLASLGMQGAFVAPAAEIHDLGRVIDELRAYVGFSYHFGIGTDLREAYYALTAAQRDQKPYVFFTEACLESELESDGGDLGEKLGPVDGPQDRRQQAPDITKSEFKIESKLIKGAMRHMAPYNPANPTDRLGSKQEGDVARWLHGDNEYADRNLVPHMTGNVRVRALHRLSGVTASRIGSNGEREFLLHRGMSPDEKNSDQRASWTPHYAKAHEFARLYRKLVNGELISPRIVSSWIPESAIVSIPFHYGRLNPRAGISDDEAERLDLPPKPTYFLTGEEVPEPILESSKYRPEHEVIVHGHGKDASPEEIKHYINPMTTANGRINAANPLVSNDVEGLRQRFKLGGVHKSEPELNSVEPQGGDPESDSGADARVLIVKALQGIKDHAIHLQGLPAETQTAIQNCLQAMVTMAHWLRGEPMEKHEALYKRLGLPAPKQLKTVVKPEQKFPDAPGPSAMAGTIKDGKIKGTSTEGKTKWHGARAGAVMGPTGVAVSSREPQAK